MCTWVLATYGGADPIDSTGTDASTSSRPARDVTLMRVPTSRHTALSASAVATAGWPITPVTPSADDDPIPGVPATSLASGTVAILARNIARSCSSSTRASSRATCSPAMIVIGPSARRSAHAITCGSPGSVPASSNPSTVGSRFRIAEYSWAATTLPVHRFGQPRSPLAAPRRCLRAAPPAGRTPTPRRTAPLRPAHRCGRWCPGRSHWPSSVVGGWPISASTGTRLANASPSPGTVFRQPPPEVAATTPIPAPLRL